MKKMLRSGTPSKNIRKQTSPSKRQPNKSRRSNPLSEPLNEKPRRPKNLSRKQKPKSLRFKRRSPPPVNKSRRSNPHSESRNKKPSRPKNLSHQKKLTPLR